jgi:hypothetical protein
VYFLHKLLWELRRDPALAARFRDDPDGVLDGYELDPAERAAIAARDFRTLYDRGANPYLLYFCALQIGAEQAFKGPLFTSGVQRCRLDRSTKGYSATRELHAVQVR